MGMRPILDTITTSRSTTARSLPYLAEDLSAHTLPARLAPGQNALGRREDNRPQPIANPGDLALASIDAAARLADTAQALN